MAFPTVPKIDNKRSSEQIAGNAGPASTNMSAPRNPSLEMQPANFDDLKPSVKREVVLTLKETSRNGFAGVHFTLRICE